VKVVTPKVVLEPGKPRRVWVNFPLSGEIAEVYLQLKERGIVHSTRDAFAQGLRCLQERVTELDLKRAQLRASQRLEEEV
jgi:hypothetical protein